MHDQFADLKTALEPLQEEERVARELEPTVPHGGRFFGLIASVAGDLEFTILHDVLLFRALTNAPGLVHVIRASRRETPDYLVAARYSSAMTAEIAISAEALSEDSEMANSLAWHTLALLRLRQSSPMLCPASSTVSWDVVAAHVGDVVIQSLDDVTRQIRLDDSRPLAGADFEWVANHWECAFRLRDQSRSRRFGLALSISYTWNHTSDPRVAISNVWAGLEALFGDRRDRRVSEALATRIAAWLPRETSKAEIRSLYSKRCDAVHGRWLEGDRKLRVATQPDVTSTAQRTRRMRGTGRVSPC
jgi:hypothetical protein